MRTGRAILRGIGYAAFLVATALVAGELFLRTRFDEPGRYYVYPPNLDWEFLSSEETTPGVEGVGHFRTNSLGLRSSEPPPDPERILYVFGGSTAIDLYLDQDEAWVQQLETRLNRDPTRPRTWVGNLSRSSLATRHNLLQMELLLPTLPRADLLVNLTGVNDFQLHLKSSYLDELSDAHHRRLTFIAMPRADPWSRHLAWVRFYNELRDQRMFSRLGLVQGREGRQLRRLRKCRASAKTIVDELPELGEGLDAYRRNLREIVDRSERYGAPIVFLTQPTLWSDDMGPEESSRLLAGGLGPSLTWCRRRQYYSPAALAQGVRRFNDVTREVCRERGLRCIDLAREIPKRALYFYDDMHFSEAGASRVASRVARGLLEMPP